MGKNVLRTFSQAAAELGRRGPVHRAITPGWHRFALHAMTFGAGLGHATTSAYDYDGQKRGQSEWVLFQYTLQGQGSLRYENQTFTLRPGQVMLLTLPHDHRYWKPPEHDWSFFYLCMQGSEIVRVWRHVIARIGPAVDLPLRSSTCQLAWRLCSRVISQDTPPAPWDVSAATYELAMSLLALAAARQQHHTQRDARQRLPGVQQAIELVRTAKRLDKLDVGSLAKAAGMSRHHFSRIFHASEGMSPGQYLTRFKLRKAVTCLETTDMPIKQLAIECGYRDANYFAKAFGKAYGLSPGDFRARQRQVG